MNTTTLRADYILWDISNRKDWQMAAKGTYEECEQAASQIWDNPNMDGMEIHPNQIKDSWDNEVTGFHYDLYMDGTCEELVLQSKG